MRRSVDDIIAKDLTEVRNHFADDHDKIQFMLELLEKHWEGQTWHLWELALGIQIGMEIQRRRKPNGTLPKSKDKV